MSGQELSHQPYKKRVFFTLLFTFLVILIIINVTLYLALTYYEFKDTQKTLKEIATKISQEISKENHEKLMNRSQQGSTEYQDIESYFKSVMAGNSKINDIYTMRTTSNPDELMFVVSGRDTADYNNNGEIEEDEEKAYLGEYYDTTGSPDMRLGLTEPSVDQEITYDKWGAWISGYAPLINDSGKSIGLVGVDFEATVIQQQRKNTFNTLLILDAVFLPITILVSYYLGLKLTRPFKTLAVGLEQIAKGNLKYRLPFKSRGDDRIFEDLFNKIRANAADAKKSYSDPEGIKKDSEDNQKFL